MHRVSTRKLKMSYIGDAKKKHTLFETRVTEYQTGGALSWD